MKSIYDILSILRTALSTNIPALITAAGLTNFEVYKIGGSRNAKQIGLFVYHDESDIEYTPESVSVIVQLQLFNIDGEEAAKYADIVTEYLRDYEPQNIECDLLQHINISSWPIDQTATTFIYITCTWSSQLDSCDNL